MLITAVYARAGRAGFKRAPGDGAACSVIWFCPGSAYPARGGGFAGLGYRDKERDASPWRLRKKPNYS